MEGQRAASSKRLRHSRHSHRHFNEVVSQGPTSIPAKDDVSAAISSVLATDESGFGQALERHRQEAQRRGSRFTSENTSVTPTASAQNGNSNDPTGRRLPSDPAGNGSNNGSNGWGGGGLLDWALLPLWVTIDALKWAGGTVNEVAVAPVIRLASPWGLADSMMATVKGFTPQRARDLARVVGNGVLNAVGLVRTPQGEVLLNTGGRAVRSLSVAVSSPAGRQLLVDSATGFVKLAEALDTPEAKNAIQQGAVVVARAMDALASRHAKIFVKDLADVVVRSVELANSREATIMAAEVTANLLHALEMEHLTGVERMTSDEAPGVDGDSLSASGERARTGQSDHRMSAFVEGTIPRLHGDGSGPDRPPGAGRVDVEPSQQTGRSGELGLESRVEQAQDEGGLSTPASGRDTRGGRVSSSEGGGEAVDRHTASGRVFDRRGQGTGMTAAELLRRGTRINPKPIRQEDLTGERPLRKLRDNPSGGKAVHRRTTGAASTSTADVASGATRSAPSSPRNRQDFCGIAAATEAETLALGGYSHSGVRAFRRRASSDAEVALGSGEIGNSGVSPAIAHVSGIEVPSSPASGVGSGIAGRGMSPRPAVEYVRDGKAFLPRFTGESFASLLRGKPLGLEQQLEAPNDGSLDHFLARAAGPLLERWSPFHQTAKKKPSESDAAVAGEKQELEAMDAAKNASVQELPESDAIPLTPGTKATRGWKQLVFAFLLLFFAADGLRHRWNYLYGGWRETSGRPSKLAPTSQTGSDSDGGARPENRFRATFLPPSCQDPMSGVTMAIWVTPGGPCLSPVEGSGGTNRGARGSFGVGTGGNEPLCAASFPLCGVDDVWHGRHDNAPEPSDPSCRGVSETRSASGDASNDDQNTSG